MDNTVGSRQRNIIIGTLLGDGVLEKNGSYYRLSVMHGMQQQAYALWIHNQLESLQSRFSIVNRFDKRSDRAYQQCLIRTRTSQSLTEFHNLFYDSGKRKIPNNLPAIINPHILAVWIMDDGYKRNDCNALRLNTQCYSLEDHSIIQQALLVLNIRSIIHKQRHLYVTYIPSQSFNSMRTLVKEWIIPEMMYKIA